MLLCPSILNGEGGHNFSRRCNMNQKLSQLVLLGTDQGESWYGLKGCPKLGQKLALKGHAPVSCLSLPCVPSWSEPQSNSLSHTASRHPACPMLAQLSLKDTHRESMHVHIICISAVLCTICILLYFYFCSHEHYFRSVVHILSLAIVGLPILCRFVHLHKLTKITVVHKWNFNCWSLFWCMIRMGQESNLINVWFWPFRRPRPELLESLVWSGWVSSGTNDIVKVLSPHCWDSLDFDLFGM